MLALAAAAALALGAPGDTATAAYAHGALALTLRYEMTCGEPGPGPLAVRLPQRFRLVSSHAYVDGTERLQIASGSTLTIDLPKPPGITCMSITEGTLKLRLTGVRAPAGTWTVRARIRTHAFAARLRIR